VYRTTASQLEIQPVLFGNATKLSDEQVAHTGSGHSLITVITPVFNGAAYLRECVESVLCQTYTDFEFIIADNCSTDESLQIAESFAKKDNRVRVVTYDEHVGPIQNWNRTLEEVGSDSRYLKFVHADDWLFPECLEKMVAVTSQDERIGIVSAYRLEEDRVSLDRLPKNCPVPSVERSFTMDGHEVGRAIFREYASVLGSPTSVLFRTDDVITDSPFFDESFLHADKEACFRLLKSRRFGFVREVLTFTRRHNDSVTSLTNTLDTRRQDDLLILLKHGPDFLTDDEMREVRNKTIRLYYAFLARSVGSGKGSDFWHSHRATLNTAECPYSRTRLMYAVLRQWLDPRSAFRNWQEGVSASSSIASLQASEFLESSRHGQRAGDD
jgi:glycosyltransferase involved in cell wall biosynthesis